MPTMIHSRLLLRSFVPLVILVSGLFGSCKKDPSDLCIRYFEPYPDMVSERVRNNVNGRYVDAMIAYRSKDYATAITGLEEFLRIPTRDMSARLYLCCAYLAVGDPYKAELQLDFIENSGVTTFNDQVDWYNALCLLCGGQQERAKEQALWIAGKRLHTYKEQASELASDL
jgi:hypothetical protein